MTLSIVVFIDTQNITPESVSQSIPKAYELPELDVKIQSSPQTPRINCAFYIYGMFQMPPKNLPKMTSTF